MYVLHVWGGAETSSPALLATLFIPGAPEGLRVPIVCQDNFSEKLPSVKSLPEAMY
jgi:hypothetical protein